MAVKVFAFLLHTVLDLTSAQYRHLQQELRPGTTDLDDIPTLIWD